MLTSTRIGTHDRTPQRTIAAPNRVLRIATAAPATSGPETCTVDAAPTADVAPPMAEVSEGMMPPGEVELADAVVSVKSVPVV